jgi:hypothetical protein
MPALLMNVKIDEQQKLDLFKGTLTDLYGLFEECHVKVRGKYSQECLDYARSQLGSGVHVYQGLQEHDWVNATLEILSHVKARSVFLYIEDHKLVASRARLEQTLADFDDRDLDYLCYSFFKASRLDVNNLLPLGVVRGESFHEFDLTAQNLSLVGKISPHYFTFSLLSVLSVEYFRELLVSENKRSKIFSGKAVRVLARIFHSPFHRRVFNKMNGVLSPFGVRLCKYPVSSPFNLEKVWFETPLSHRVRKFGVLTRELFANCDDDNGAYGESLIKKGRYPFDMDCSEADPHERLHSIEFYVALNRGESFDSTYYSHNDLIRSAPRVECEVTRGEVTVLYQGRSVQLAAGEAGLFYSNMGPVIKSTQQTELKIRVFDERF